MNEHVRGSIACWARGVFALVCGAGLGLNAWAVGGVNATYGGLMSKVTAANVTVTDVYTALPTIGGQAFPGGVKAVGQVALTGPGGAAVASDFAVLMSRKAVLIEGAALLGRALPTVALALAAYDIYDAIRVNQKAGSGLQEDAGQTTEAVTSYVSNNASNTAYNSGHSQPAYYGESEVEAAQAALNGISQASASWGCAGGGTGCWQFRSVGCDAHGCDVQRRNRYDPSAPWSDWVGEGHWGADVAGVQQLCPKIDDPSNPGQRYRPPKSVGDGRCRTGMVIGITPENAAQKLQDATSASFQDGLDYPRVAREAAPFQVPSDAQQEIVLPSVQPQHLDGPEVNTTAPSGITTKDRTTWDLMQRDLNDLKNSAKWKETHTYTYTDPQGNVTPGGSSTTSPGGGGAGPDEPDLCALHPEILACAKIGEAPTDQTPKRTFALTWAAEAVSLPSGCPSPVAMADGVVVDYTQICDAATKARPFVLVGAAFSALMLVLATLRGG